MVPQDEGPVLVSKDACQNLSPQFRVPDIVGISLIQKLVCGSGKFSAAPFSLCVYLLPREGSLVAGALMIARGKGGEAPCEGQLPSGCFSRDSLSPKALHRGAIPCVEKGAVGPSGLALGILMQWNQGSC